MAKLNPMISMEMDDESKLDAIQPIVMPTKPDYPYGLRISLSEKELEKLELDHKDAVVGGMVHGHFLARITSCSEETRDGNETCRIELQIENLAIESEDEENSST